MPAAILLVWALTTLSWWAFAFAPLPASPPEWLAAARHACFGAGDSGWPSADGWVLLVAAPGTLLAFIVIVWRGDLGGSVRRVACSTWGRALLALVLVTALVEAAWVADRLRTARAVATWQPTPLGAGDALPADYPRHAMPASDFALTDQHGAAVSLAALRGRPVVVTFVFAHCESLCPMLVQQLKRAAPDADVLLVTLDPWRDTPGALPALARRWELPARFHVLSAQRVDDVLHVIRAWDVPFERDPRTGDISHPGLLYVVDPAGRLAYTFNNPPGEWIREAVHRAG
jgi:cytochrome oxidase Cu insertion factor (SCO1/SenC/PrrC family)